MPKKNPQVDGYIRKNKCWQNELQELRRIILQSDLHEEMKWMVPCYTSEGRNIVLLHVFKEYCAILFVKGALLEDAGKILIQQTKNVQAARQLRFTNAPAVTASEALLKQYIEEAIAVEKKGLKVPLKKTSEFAVAEEFQKKLAEIPALKKAFETLTPGRQRGYYLHFSSAKQSKTRAARVAKCMNQILAGKGLDD